MRDEWTPNAPLQIGELFSQPLPSANPAQLPPYNQLAQCPHFATVKIRDKDVSFRLTPVSHDRVEPTYTISIVLGEKSLKLGCSIDSFEMLFGDAIDPSACDLNLLRILVHLLVDDFDAPLSDLSGDRAKLDITTDAAPVLPLDMALAMQVAGQDATSTLTISGDLDLLVPLFKAGPTVMPQKLSRQLNIECRVVSGAFTTAPGGVKAVERDDLIYIDHIPSDGLFSLKVAESEIAHVTLAKGKLIVTQILSTTKDPLQKGNQKMASDVLQDITTQMTLEIGEWTMSLDEIDALVPGSVLDVGQVDTNAVKVRLNGKIVASGALINLGEGVGIQIRALT